jgi:hypothetical protein
MEWTAVVAPYTLETDTISISAAFDIGLPLFEKDNASAVPVSFAAHKTSGNQRLPIDATSYIKIQAAASHAHKIGHRLQFVQNIVYNLAFTLRANSV